LRQYFEFYNYDRPHQSLKYQTPFEAYQKGRKTEQNKGVKATISDKQFTP
jgi:transposase InsO family protein